MSKAARRARMERQEARPAVLAALGTRVRELREAHGQTRRELSAASGLSERFLADLEAGEGNISLQRLDELGRALGTTSVALLSRAQPEETAAPERLRTLLSGLNREELQEAQRWLKARFGGGGGRLVALLGLRGAGKSTIGRKRSQRLSVPFIELDQMVERAAGLSLPGLFSLHGEAYYRRSAREGLTRCLAETEAAVIATGGSLVTDRDAFRLLQKRCTTVWLQARPEDHWQRVLAQGDERPGAASPHAQAELRALLKAREPLYAQADLAVDTSKPGVQAALGPM